MFDSVDSWQPKFLYKPYNVRCLTSEGLGTLYPPRSRCRRANGVGSFFSSVNPLLVSLARKRGRSAPASSPPFACRRLMA